MYQTLTPNLMVNDVCQSLNWYRDVLGFELQLALCPGDKTPLTEVDETQALEFAILIRDKVCLMLQERASMASELPALAGIDIGASQVLYVELDDVDGHYLTTRDKVEVVAEPRDQFYGMREWYCRDCNGYILCFAQDLRDAQAAIGGKDNDH